VGALASLGAAPFAAGLCLVAASLWYSFTICIAIGAATVGPEPPCSTRTTTAISGAFAGEYAANHAWSRARYQAFFGSSPPVFT